MRNANIAYAIEVLQGRLNGSSETVEVNKSGNKNTSYVKKIGGRGLVSGNCQKYNMIKYLEDVGKFEISKRKKIEKEVFSKTLPHKYVNEDLFGFMKAQNIVITEEEYQALDEIEQSLFVKNGKKGYKQNITKKRMSRVHLSSLVNISNTKINTEFKVTTTDTENMLYNVETYSGLMAGIANIDIENIGKFKISDLTSEFRDYTPEEDYNENEIALTEEERKRRIIAAIESLQFLNISGNQNNYLTDTTPKVVIIGEYGWGNNVFYGIIKGNGIDIEALKESLDDNEKFRQSNVWIGISSKMYNENYNKEYVDKLKESMKEYGFVSVGTVGQAFKGYIDFLKETL